jgi:hypothetical protein
MKRLLTFAALLPSLPALAATQEDVAANAPVQTADPVVVWVFIIGFIAAIVGACVWYFWSDDETPKEK